MIDSEQSLTFYTVGADDGCRSAPALLHGAARGQLLAVHKLRKTPVNVFASHAIGLVNARQVVTRLFVLAPARQVGNIKAR